MDHPIESLMRTTMENLKAMVDVNTVVGEPVETKDGAVIVPVSKVSFGFVAGGGDEPSPEGCGAQSGSGSGQGEASATERPLPFAGGAGAGVSVRPMGFLVVGDGKIRFLPVDRIVLYDRLLEIIPDVLDKLADAAERHCRTGHEAEGGPSR